MDVVVEARQPPAEALEDLDRGVLLEVLPLQDGVWEHLDEPLDEGVHHPQVGIAPQPRVAPAQVGRISSRLGLSVPTSSETGRVIKGGIPAPAEYRASLPMAMPIPPAPRSPKPRIRSLSVATTSRTPRRPELRSSSPTASTSSGVIQIPRGRRMVRLYSWQARPTVGV